MRWILLLLVAVGPFASASAVYKCVDASGKTNFTDLPCEGGAGDSSGADSGGLPFIEPQYRADVLGMLNRLSVSHPACKQRLDPMTAAKSTSRGTASNPSFFVQCGDTQVPEVVRFTLEEARSGVAPAVSKPIPQMAAMKACRSAAKERSLNPGSLDFSTILHAGYEAKPNGNVVYSSSFTVLNGLGVEQRFFIWCRFEGESLTDVSIKPDA